MKRQFVNKKIAIKLQELGFDEPCICGYNSYGALKNNLCMTHGELSDYITINKYDNKVNAQLYQQVLEWFREKYKMNIVIQNTYYGRKDEIFKVAYFFFIEGDTPNNLVYDYQDLYNEVLDASERVNLGDHINEELYDKNIFEIGFAYKTYEECREKAILKCIELCKQ